MKKIFIGVSLIVLSVTVQNFALAQSAKNSPEDTAEKIIQKIDCRAFVSVYDADVLTAADYGLKDRVHLYRIQDIIELQTKYDLAYQLDQPPFEIHFNSKLDRKENKIRTTVVVTLKGQEAYRDQIVKTVPWHYKFTAGRTDRDQRILARKIPSCPDLYRKTKILKQ